MQQKGSEGTIQALQEILSLSKDIGTSLLALDVEGFESAIVAREGAFGRLSLASTPSVNNATDANFAHTNDGMARDLAAQIQELEDRNRSLSQAVLSLLRDQLRNMNDGKRALAGYRPPSSSKARFTNRRG